MRARASAVILSLVAGCSRTSPPAHEPVQNHTEAPHDGMATPDSGGTRDAGAAPAPSRPPPDAPATRPLEVPGFDPAILSVPSGGMAKQPVLIAAHGAGDNPAWQCETWRALLGDRATILCLSGPRENVHGEGRYFPDHYALEKIAFASIDALRRALPDPAAASRIVYTGYSQGATMGALMIVTHGETCPRLALIEGGFDGWTLGRAEKFKQSGGERVLFVCGTAHCRKRAESSAQTLERAGVAARVVSDLSGGHNYGGAVGRALKASFGWLVEGDPAWTASP